MPQEVRKLSLRQDDWLVQRHGKVEEVHQADGRIIYRVKVWDDGRDPFITNTFNDEVPALSFLERVRTDGEVVVEKLSE